MKTFSIFATPTPAEYVRIVAGALPVVTREGAIVPHRLTTAQRASLEEAQARRYLSVEHGVADEALENVFFLWCDMRGLPYARLRRNGAHAQVTLDFIRVPRARQFSPSVTMEADSFLEAFASRQGWPHTARVHVSLMDGYWSVRPVPVAFADEMIRGLVEMATRALAASLEGGAQ